MRQRCLVSLLGNVVALVVCSCSGPCWYVIVILGELDGVAVHLHLGQDPILESSEPKSTFYNYLAMAQRVI